MMMRFQCGHACRRPGVRSICGHAKVMVVGCLLFAAMGSAAFAQSEDLPEESTQQVAQDEYLSDAVTALSQTNDALGAATDALATAQQAVEAAQANQKASDSSKYNALIAALSIFVLAVFVGFEVITKVPPTLHTPLMSGSNAISGITLVGALLVAGRGDYASLLGAFAVVFAMINVVGGFWVTHRMLSMFQR